MVAPWIANRLAARGYRDAYVRTLLATTLIATAALDCGAARGESRR